MSLELHSPHPPDVCALRLEAALAGEAGRRAPGLSRQVAGVRRGHGFALGYRPPGDEGDGEDDGDRAAERVFEATLDAARAGASSAGSRPGPPRSRWIQGRIEAWGEGPGSRIRLESDRRPTWDRVEQLLFYLAWTLGFLLLFWTLAYLRRGELARAGGTLIAMSVPLLLAALYYRPSLIGRVAIEDRRLISFVRAACDADLVEVRDLPARGEPPADRLADPG